MDIPEKWKDPAYVPELKVQMVDPWNLEVSRGELSGITKVTTTDGYYSDTKVSGSIETIGDNYIAGSWLRIIVDGEPVATFGAQFIKPTQAPEGAKKKTYTLQSVLWMLDADINSNLVTIGQNTKCSTAIKSISKTVGKTVKFSPGWRDSLYQAAKVYERTDSYRKILADICSKANDQLSVDGYGRIDIAPYVEPSSKTSTWTLDVDDPKGIVLDPGYEDNDETGSAYNRTVVIASGSNDQTIVASSDAPASDPVSSAQRGWTRTQVHQVSDMQPFTQDQAQKLMNQYIPDDRSRGITRSCSCMYFPVKGGDVVDWVQDGKRSRYLVQTVDDDYFAWTSKLTMKKL
jgi:hypothetical protein